MLLGEHRHTFGTRPKQVTEGRHQLSVYTWEAKYILQASLSFFAKVWIIIYFLSLLRGTNEKNILEAFIGVTGSLPFLTKDMYPVVSLLYSPYFCLNKWYCISWSLLLLNSKTYIIISNGTVWNSAEEAQGTYNFFTLILQIHAQRINPLCFYFDLGFK